jgi:hypothetical protein
MVGKAATPVNAWSLVESRKAGPPDEVRVRVIYGLRDWSGDWDDDFEGRISFAVIAE